MSIVFKFKSETELAKILYTLSAGVTNIDSLVFKFKNKSSTEIEVFNSIGNNISETIDRTNNSCDDSKSRCNKLNSGTQNNSKTNDKTENNSKTNNPIEKELIFDSLNSTNSTNDTNVSVDSLTLSKNQESNMLFELDVETRDYLNNQEKQVHPYPKKQQESQFQTNTKLRGRDPKLCPHLPLVKHNEILNSNDSKSLLFKLELEHTLVNHLDYVLNDYLNVKKLSQNTQLLYKRAFRKIISYKVKDEYFSSICSINTTTTISTSARTVDDRLQQSIILCFANLLNYKISMLVNDPSLKYATRRIYAKCIYTLVKHSQNVKINSHGLFTSEKNLNGKAPNTYLNDLNISTLSNSVKFDDLIKLSLKDINSFEEVFISNQDNLQVHRKALNCDRYLNISDARKSYKAFLSALCHDNSNMINRIKLWIIHSILCTRRSETIRIIKKFKKNTTTVEIKTKTHSSYIFPIIKQLGKIIEDVQGWVNSLSNRTAEEYIYRTIPEKYRDKMCAHGSRAFFRTVIELMNTKFSFEVKEAYLTHNVLNSVQSAYLRTNYLHERAKLQEVWMKWILEQLPRNINCV